MGFYDCTCTITGVSLIDDATCVLLRLRDGRFSPVALPVRGGYDRQGAVDGIDENRNTELMVAYFGAQRQAGRFFAEDDTSNIDTVWPSPSPDYRSLIDGLIWLVERNTTVWHAMQMGSDPMVSFDGDPIVLALVAQPIWNAIVADAAATPPAAVEATFEEVFDRDPIPMGLYRTHLPDISEQLGELAAVAKFMAAHDRVWAPPGDYGQHWEEEMLGYLERARVAFQDVPTVLSGLDVYAEGLDELLRLRRG